MVAEEEDEVFVDGSSRSTADSTHLEGNGDDEKANDDDDLSEIQWNWTGTTGLLDKDKNNKVSILNSDGR